MRQHRSVAGFYTLAGMLVDVVCGVRRIDMASSSPWDPGLTAPASSITRFIKGSRMTWFYALWIYHKGGGWTIWLGCPKAKIVRLIRLFQRRQHTEPTDVPWTAPVIPLRSLGQRQSEHRRHKP